MCALALALSSQALAQDLSIALNNRRPTPGEALLVTISAPSGTTDVIVDVFGVHYSAFKTDDTTWRALVGVDLDQEPGTYALVAAGSGPHALQGEKDLVVRPKQFRRRVLKVAPDYVNPPPDLLERIESEAAFLREVYDHSSAAPSWRSGFTRPVADRANSSFGTRSVFNGESRSPHAGIDFLSSTGTPIHAPAGGRVVGARNLFFTGNTVVIDHGLGVFSMLAHLSRMDVQEGEDVNAGDTIGLVGATGRVTGPHLHWAMRVGPARVNPLSALAVFRNSQ